MFFFVNYFFLLGKEGDKITYKFDKTETSKAIYMNTIIYFLFLLPLNL